MSRHWVRAVLVAGLAAGAAEVAWILAYGGFGTVDPAAVAAQVAATVLPAVRDSIAPALGIVIHFALSVALAFGFALLMRDELAKLDLAAAVIAASALLVCVWGLNFLIVLPRLNPGFLTLMPYGVTFLSKLLFGLTLGLTLALLLGPRARRQG